MKRDIIFTPKGYQELLEKKQKLLNERPDAVEHLRKAREMGDLSENGYYKAARARLSFIDAQLRRLDDLIRRARVVEKEQTSRVEIGSVVTIRDQETEATYTIAGSHESDPANHIISHLSPIGKALMGKMQGETVEVQTPSGIKRFIIQSIE